MNIFNFFLKKNLVMDIVWNYDVITLTLGSWLKQRHGKVQTKNATWKSHLHFKECGKCEGMSRHTFKWTFTLEVGVPTKS